MGTSAKGKGKALVLSDSDSDEEVVMESVAKPVEEEEEEKEEEEKEEEKVEEEEVEDLALEVYTKQDDTILVRNVARTELKGLNRENLWVALANKV